jgi:hypothetical protein
MIDIRRCGNGDMTEVMTFIDRHWRKGHVLATNRRLMDWQHKEEDGSYNYLLAREGDELLAVLGYIPTRRFDPALKDSNMLWLALWKTRDDIKVAGLGLRLLQALGRVEPHCAMGVSGINPAHPPMYTSLGYQVKKLRQYYFTHPGVPLSLVSAKTSGKNWPLPRKGNAVLAEMKTGDLLTLRWKAQATPQKTPMYFGHRFLDHPFYRYRVFLISCAGNQGLIATRVAIHRNAAALRIVDFSGDINVLAQSGSAFHRLMQEESAEYADFWHCGLPDGVLEAAGFEYLDPDGPVTAPNYFEPFLAKNGRILCAVKSKTTAPILVFRADGDQDRPNALQ